MSHPTQSQANTLFAIAYRHKVDPKAVIEANPHIAHPNYVKPGTRVQIPPVPKPTEGCIAKKGPDPFKLSKEIYYPTAIVTPKLYYGVPSGNQTNSVHPYPPTINPYHHNHTNHST